MDAQDYVRRVPLDREQQRVHLTEQESFFWESGRALITKFPGQLRFILHTPVPPASQPLPWSSRILHTLLELRLQEAHKPTITHTKPELRGGAQSRCLSRGIQWKKNKKVTSACPPASFVSSSHKRIS